ncbi:vesicle docking protein [Capsaspora owczarzaki ATCC 30864]|uniref:Vesicle docking protein n=1 Tax=Capsaspora owczarzaki (strain ATCC 30864) TaxID=595528 RepID=A0A0D2WHW7_CAPO3|nr:vesicle docking protein [Capsaspora owczarzaki ATCC 30864]KJE89305.1 vesicle docking protein [Capsaspora owczarzaki ATCC 30864]|eukprot:XP_004365674.2 vesicle docking protein [Capsaspora owczarzaki ATCC 30864]
MSFFNSIFSTAAPTQTGLQTVEKLCDRLEHSTLLEDRRNAVRSLKSLAKEYQADVGRLGLHLLLHVLENDSTDADITRFALETLIALCTSKPSQAANTTAAGAPADDDLGLRFTEAFIQMNDTVSLLLSLLAENDFYVRYTTVQLLTLLLTNRSDQLQNCILAAPMGISRLMDLLKDSRESIRNEALLLLVQLTRSNQAIQKIVTFENAFELLLDIMEEEGFAEGGIIVQDCLHLMSNLLRKNVTNQNYFRETSCVPRLVPFLRSLSPSHASASAPPAASHHNNGSSHHHHQHQHHGHEGHGHSHDGDDDHESHGHSHAGGHGGGDAQTPQPAHWTEQKTANAVLGLQLIRILVPPNNTSIVITQKTMLQHGIIALLAEIALFEDLPPRVKCEALSTAAEVIRGLPASQDAFAQCRVSVNGAIVATPLALLFAMLEPRRAFAERSAALYLFQSLVLNNEDMQTAVASTLPGNSIPFMPARAAAGRGQSSALGSGIHPSSSSNNLIATAGLGSGGVTLVAHVQGAGELLANGLFNAQDPLANWLCSIALGSVITNSTVAKDMALSSHISARLGEKPLSLMSQCTNAMTQVSGTGALSRSSVSSPSAASSDPSSTPRTLVGLLRLLCSWLADSPAAVRTFLHSTYNLPFLVELLEQHHSTSTGAVSVVIQGMAALLLGLCFAHNDVAESTFNRASIRLTIQNRINLETFNGYIANLGRCEYFTKAASNTSFSSTKPGDVWFDYEFTVLFKRASVAIERALDPAYEHLQTLPQAPSAPQGYALPYQNFGQNPGVASSPQQQGQPSPMPPQQQPQQQHQQQQQQYQQPLTPVQQSTQQPYSPTPQASAQVADHSADHALVLQNFKDLIRKQDSEIAQLRAAVSQRDSEIATLTTQVQASKQSTPTLPSQGEVSALQTLTTLQQEHDSLKADHEALLGILAEYDDTKAKYRQRILDLGGEVTDEEEEDDGESEQ